MEGAQFFDDDFKTAIRLAGAQARIETLQAGVSVFYWDRVRQLNVIEHLNGRKFEIRFLDDAPVTETTK